MLPRDSSLEIFDVSVFPLYSQDPDGDLPLSVREFKQKLRQADAILIASPEHNYSITAQLKNAIEWGNRPPGDNSWKASQPRSSALPPEQGAESDPQLHLRQIMVDPGHVSHQRARAPAREGEESFR